MSHIEDIQDLLHIIPDFIPENVCDELIEYCDKRPQIFKDRTKYFPNYGLNGDLGKYYAAEVSPFSLVELWDKYFNLLEVEGFFPKEVQINKYNKGAFIPPHTDDGLVFHTVVVPLQTNPNNMLIFGDPDVYHNNLDIDQNIKNDKIKVFRDKKGYGYRFDGNSPIHWVPPVEDSRYSLVIIF